MDGAHDMGGVSGFGAVVPEPNEPAFHAAWEKRAFAVTLAMATPGGWNIDMSRFAREDRPSGEYLNMSYFEIWIAGLERLASERGLLSANEIRNARAEAPIKPVARILKADQVAAMLHRGSPTERLLATPARFAIGDRARARDIHPVTHTRLPGYVRGKIGTIERLHGFHVFADAHAMGDGEQPQWLYAVAFRAGDLWSDAPDPGARVSVDAWESYLEPAS